MGACGSDDIKEKKGAKTEQPSPAVKFQNPESQRTAPSSGAKEIPPPGWTESKGRKSYNSNSDVYTSQNKKADNNHGAKSGVQVNQNINLGGRDDLTWKTREGEGYPAQEGNNHKISHIPVSQAYPVQSADKLAVIDEQPITRTPDSIHHMDLKQHSTTHQNPGYSVERFSKR